MGNLDMMISLRLITNLKPEYHILIEKKNYELLTIVFSNVENQSNLW